MVGSEQRGWRAGTKPSSKTPKRSTACRGSTWSKGPRVRRLVNPRMGASGWTLRQVHQAAGGPMGEARRSTHGSCRGRNRVVGCTMAGLHGRAPEGSGR